MNIVISRKNSRVSTYALVKLDVRNSALQMKENERKSCKLIARKSALEKTQLSDVLITDNLF